MELSCHYHWAWTTPAFKMADPLRVYKLMSHVYSLKKSEGSVTIMSGRNITKRRQGGNQDDTLICFLDLFFLTQGSEVKRNQGEDRGHDWAESPKSFSQSLFGLSAFPATYPTCAQQPALTFFQFRTSKGPHEPICSVCSITCQSFLPTYLKLVTTPSSFFLQTTERHSICCLCSFFSVLIQ